MLFKPGKQHLGKERIVKFFISMHLEVLAPYEGISSFLLCLDLLVYFYFIVTYYLAHSIHFPF